MFPPIGYRIVTLTLRPRIVSCILVNVGSANGVLPARTMLLTEQMLPHCQLGPEEQT